jgi:hypothetical protein
LAADNDHRCGDGGVAVADEVREDGGDPRETNVRQPREPVAVRHEVGARALPCFAFFLRRLAGIFRASWRGQLPP